MTKFLNTLLVLIIAIAGGRLAMRAQEYRAFAQERVELIEKLDGFHVRDPSKYLVQFVENDDPMLFTWRVYNPDSFRKTALLELGSDHFSFVNPYRGPYGDFMWVSLRFDIIGDRLYVDTQYSGGGRRQSRRGKKLAAFCERHWCGLEIEAFGKGEPIEVAADQIAELVSITIPDEVFARLKDEYGEELASRFSGQRFFRLSYGDEAAIGQFLEQSQDGLK